MKRQLQLLKHCLLTGTTFLLLTCVNTVFSQTVMEEGFESSMSLPTGWTTDAEDADDWMIDDGMEAYSAASGVNYAYFFSQEYASKLISPEMDFSAYQNLIVSFEYINKIWGNDYDSLKLFYRVSSSDPWVQFGSAITVPHADWNHAVAVLPNPSATYSIAFEAYGGYGYGIGIDDIKIEAVSCLPVENVAVFDITDNSTNISWTSPASASLFAIKYALAGTSNWTTVTTAASPYVLNNLDPSQRYTIQVGNICGAGDTSEVSSVTFNTACGIMEALTLCENFSPDSPSSGCWTTLNEDGNWEEFIFEEDYYTPGEYYAILYSDYEEDDYLISPQVELAGNEALTMRVNIESSGDQLPVKVLLSTTGTNPADFTEVLYDELLTGTGGSFQDVTVDLSGYTGSVYLAVHILNDMYYFGAVMIKDFCIKECTIPAGNDVTVTACRTSQVLDLATVIDINTSAYSWDPLYAGLINVDNELNLSILGNGVHHIKYYTEGVCRRDSAIINLTLLNGSSAGNDNNVPLCRNQPVALNSLLVGTVDMGGVWLDPNGQPVASGQIVTSNLPGQYDFKYIVANGSCPADTAAIRISVQGCDFLGIESVSAGNVIVYPNPATEFIMVQNESNVEISSISVSDLNGRILYQGEGFVNSEQTYKIDMSQYTKGIYLVNVQGAGYSQIIKVVKE